MEGFRIDLNSVLHHNKSWPCLFQMVNYWLWHWEIRITSLCYEGKLLISTGLAIPAVQTMNTGQKPLVQYIHIFCCYKKRFLDHWHAANTKWPVANQKCCHVYANKVFKPQNFLFKAKISQSSKFYILEIK